MCFTLLDPRGQIDAMSSVSFSKKTTLCASIRLLIVVATMASSLLSPVEALSVDELFAPDKLLDVQITLKDSDWNTARREKRSMAQALGEERRQGKPESPFHYVPAKVTINGEVFDSVGIRKKGFIGSLDDERPSLKVKFNFSDPDATLGGMTQLTLNNNKQDGALVSQTMTYALFNAAGLVAPRTSYAKVSVNGTPLGIYTNVEPAKGQLVTRGFGSANGTLFEGTIVDFFDGWATGFEHKFGPEDAGRERIQALIEVLDGPNESLVAAIEEIIDLDRYLKFWAIESLIGFWDGYSGNQNNFFVYHHPQTNKLHFLPWGADSVFTSRGMFDRGGPQAVKARGRLSSRLYEIPAIQERYRRVMLGLLESNWNEEALLEETERIEALVGDDLHARQGGFKEALERTREFFASRRGQIVEELKDGAPEIRGGASEPMYFSKVGKIEGEISGRWFSKAPSAASEIGDANVRVMLDGEEVEFKEIGVHAVMGRFGFRGPGQPNINIVGERASDGERVTLVLMIDGDSFQPSGEAMISVGGMMRQGEGFGFGPGGVSPIDGKIQIVEASQEEGAPVKAKVSANIMKMVGGFFGRGGGGGPPRRGGPGGRGSRRPGRPE